MESHTRRFDLRTFGLIGLATLLGASWATFNLIQAGGSSATGTPTQLVWTVFATPFFTFWGWLLARRNEGWWAAFVCFCIYFFGVLLGSRLERLIVGDVAASESFHALYFRLTLVIQLAACLVVALQRSRTHGTISQSTN